MIRVCYFFMSCGFSLGELLVLIAIIVILMAFLLPAVLLFQREDNRFKLSAEPPRFLRDGFFIFGRFFRNSQNVY